MSNLQSIELRQKRMAVRDVLFALCVGLAAIVAASSVSTGATAVASLR